MLFLSADAVTSDNGGLIDYLPADSIPTTAGKATLTKPMSSSEKPIDVESSDDDEDPIDDEQLDEYREMVEDLGVFPVSCFVVMPVCK